MPSACNAPFDAISDHLETIRMAANPEDLSVLSRTTAPLIAGLIQKGEPPLNIIRMTSCISDHMIIRFIEWSMDELGPPPSAFAFVVFGSEGRMEQTLTTDQDSALVYDDLDGHGQQTARDYFPALGKRVCARLNSAGYALCKGDTMAMNPLYCKPMSHFERDVAKWVIAAEERDLMRVRMFYDMRRVYGEARLVDTLRIHLENLIQDNPRFLQILTRHILQVQVPLGFMGRIVVEKEGPKRGSFNIKNAMMPLVDYARLYAMKHGIRSTGTVTRLDALLGLNVLAEGTHRTMTETFSGLMNLRLTGQARAVGSVWATPSNDIFPNSLNAGELRHVKDLLENIRTFKARVGFDFTGQWSA